MADRGLLLSHVPTRGLKGFEIGALMSPFLPRADHDVTLVDRLSTAELRAKYATEAGVAVDEIADVDVVVGNGDLFGALASRAEGGFDFAIASHVIEHVPDIVGWLSDIAKLVRVGGRLLLVIPDRRYTFDYFRQVSTLPSVIDSWVRGCRTPSPGQVFDYTANAADVDKGAAWSGMLDPSTLSRYCTARWALDVSRESHEKAIYVDSHCWVFTSASFLDLCADLAALSILSWKLVFFADTRRNEEDFGVVFERTVSEDDRDCVADAFRAAARGVADTDAGLHAEVTLLRSELARLTSSASWRITAPLRRLRRAWPTVLIRQGGR